MMFGGTDGSSTSVGMVGALEYCGNSTPWVYRQAVRASAGKEVCVRPQEPDSRSSCFECLGQYH